MARTRGILVLATSLAIIATTCGGPTEAEPATGIPPQEPDLVAAGEVVYQAACAVCHGTDLRGTDLGPSHLSVVYEPGHHGDGAFETAVLIGSRQHHWNFGNMPPVTGLSDADVDAVIAFVREQQRIHGFEPYPP